MLSYADNVVVGSRYLEWLQGSLNVLIGLFRVYRLVENVTKSRAMTCQLGTLWSGMQEESVVRRCMFRVLDCHERLRMRIPSSDYRIEIIAVLMTAHRSQMHGTEPGIDWNRLPVSQT